MSEDNGKIPWRKPGEISSAMVGKPLLVVCGAPQKPPFLVIGRVVFEQSPVSPAPAWKYDPTYYDFSRPFFITDEIIAWCELTRPDWSANESA